MLAIHLSKNNPENLGPISVSYPLGTLVMDAPRTSRENGTGSTSHLCWFL